MPKLKEEAVVYSAHYDAYGIDGSGRIFPGAADNALGTATITAIAEAFAKAFSKPHHAAQLSFSPLQAKSMGCSARSIG